MNRKQKRDVNRKKCGIWLFSPVTRIAESSKKYSRKIKHKMDGRDDSLPSQLVDKVLCSNLE